MQVVCFMNIFYMLILISTLVAVRFACLGYDQPSIENKLYLLVLSGAAIFFAWVAYNLAIQSVYSWGSMVKAGFDCYLPELAKKLGYELPKDGHRQREFWLAISRRAIYNRKLNPASWTPIETGPEVQATKSQLEPAAGLSIADEVDNPTASTKDPVSGED